MNESISDKQKNAEEWNFLGVTQFNSGKTDDAIISFSQSISTFDQLPEVISNLAYCYMKKNQNEKTIQLEIQALKINACLSQSWLILGIAQLNLEKPDDAYFSFNKGLEIDPNHPALLNALGALMQNRGKLIEAAEYYRKAIEVDKNYIDALCNLGGVLLNLFHYEESLAIIEKALILNPNDAPSLNAKGMYFFRNEKYHEAIQYYQRAIVLDPFLWTARSNFGMALLLLGDLKRGFIEYEYRKKLSNYYFMQTPAWQGEPIEGKTLLVRWEQGLGDSIQMLRYLPYFNQAKCKIIIELQSSLHCLFDHLGFEFISNGVPKHDLHVHFVSLPTIFKTDLSNIPPPISIKNANPSPIKNRVAIVWKGNAGYGKDRLRSLDLNLLDPLLQIPGVHFICLQKDLTLDEEQFLNARGVEIPRIETFTDTLRELEKCERLICPDTSIAHLAGSIGIPTWILLSFAPDWKWLLERKDSPWYPSVRLFRQKSLHNWSEPIEEIKKLLI